MNSSRASILAAAVVLASCGAAPAPTAATPAGGPSEVPAAGSSSARPFLLGAFVGANLHDWGDITGMGSDSVTCIREICDDVRSMGMNAVWVTGFAPFFAEEPLMGVWLDEADRRDLDVVIEGSGEPYCIPRQPADHAEEVLRLISDTIVPAWRRIAGTYGRHPALLAYAPVEEIGDNIELGENHTVRALAEVGRAVAEIDPVHPVTTIHIASWYNVAVEEARLRRGPGGLRVLVFDLYLFTNPIPEWQDVVDQNLSATTPDEIATKYLDFLDRYVALGRANGVPVWIMAQSYGSNWTRKIDGRPVTRPLARFPNEAEMRFQVWAAALAGARGVWFFQYQSTPPPSAENRATLEEWEEGFGIRRLDGTATSMHASLAAAAGGIGPHLDLLGRAEPEGGIERQGQILSRRFRDPADGSTFTLRVNRDLAAAHDGIPAGDGRIVR